MADQAPLGGGSRTRAESRGNGSVVGSIAELGNDIMTLAELQAKLLALDLKECTAQAGTSLALILAGLTVMLASLPVAVLGVAYLVADALGIKPGWAMLLTVAVVLVLGGVLLAVCVPRLRRSFAAFRRSREELNRNLSWIRTVLLYSGRSAPRRGA